MKEGELNFHDGEHNDAKLKPIGKNEFKKMSGSNRTTIKLSKEENEKAMYVRIGQRPPLTLLEFQATELTDDQLNQYIGNYHSDELDATYHLKFEDRKLQIFLGEKQIVQFDPLMDDLFNSAHDGYIKFEKLPNGSIEEFTINDYSLGSMSFFKE